MKNRSKQQKSRYLQNLVKDRIIKLYPSLTKKDIRTSTTGENGADVNQRDYEGETALHTAVFHSKGLRGWKGLSVIRLLMKAGADANAKRNDGKTPLDWARIVYYGPKSRPEYQKVFHLLSGYSGNLIPDNSIHKAAKTGNIEEVKKHLDLDAETYLNAKDKSGKTPLHLANNREIVALLIADGADVNTKDKNGNTPLDIAAENQNTEITDLIRIHGGKTRRELEAEGK